MFLVDKVLRVAHQMAKEVTLLPSVIKFGPHFLNDQNSMASIVNAVHDVGTEARLGSH